MDIVPLAASLLVLRNDGKLLAVSRKHDPNDFGLPGGKVDPGESPETAIVREAHEEIGLVIYKVTPVFTRICRGKAVPEQGILAQDYLNTTFVAASYGSVPRQQGGEGRLAWIPPRLLYFGGFGPYNAQMLKTMMIDPNPEVPHPDWKTHPGFSEFWVKQHQELLELVEEVGDGFVARTTLEQAKECDFCGGERLATSSLSSDELEKGRPEPCPKCGWMWGWD